MPPTGFSFPFPMLERFGGLVDRFTFYAPYPHPEDLFAQAIQELRAANRAGNK